MVSLVSMKRRLILIGLIITILICSITVAFIFYQNNNKITTSNTSYALLPPKGIYALIDWNADPLEDTWTKSYVDGVVIRTYWKDLNPDKDSYNWNYLDRQFIKAAKYGKKVRLMVAPGFYSPDFIIKDSGITKAIFKVPQGPYKDSQKPLPLPWDERYLALWFNFIDQLSKRYSNNPSFSYISITGPNSHNGEISLPRDKSDSDTWLSLTGTANTLFQNLASAWSQTIDHYCTTFTKNHFTLALILRSLPIQDNAELQNKFMDTLASYGTTKCPATFGIQTNGLDAKLTEEGDPSPHQWELIQNYSGQVLTGFQTRDPNNLYQCPKREARCEKKKQDIFNQAIITNGLSRKPNFIEVYESDISDPLLATILDTAHQNLISR